MDFITIKQGDDYKLALRLRLGGEALSVENAERIEFSLGQRLRFLWPGDVTYDDGTFYLPLTQSDTLRLTAGTELPLDVRVKFEGGSVVGAVRPAIVRVTDAVSCQIL